MKNRYLFLTGAAAILLSACGPKVEPPAPVYPIPEQKQVDWQKMETYAFVHFGLNTFNDREWGYGDSDPKTFNPTRLDCEQWVQTFKKAGLKGVILTAKHHDGFCLWPTKLTEYCIRNTPYKDGKGDIVGELAAACQKHGLKFAVYLSPWDRNHAQYGTPAYVDYYHAQLRELMTQYGDVFEVWFDGANGGDGWYGGARETRTIDRKNYYNYPEIYRILDELQPQAVVFSDGGPGCRWVGNESGYAGATNWSFLRKGEVYPGYPHYRELQYGHADGDQWVPAECDVSIRPGWFYHPEQDSMVKSVDHLTDLYYRSVGHNATLLLNFPVDREGRVHPVDSANAVNFHLNVQKQLAHNLLKGICPTVSAERGGEFTADAMTDDDYDTYWATPDSVVAADVCFDLGQPQRVNRMMIQEYIPLGQRVKSFVVEYDAGGEWVPVRLNEETTTVGYKRLLRFATVETSRLRIRFLDARGPLTINNVEAFYAGETADVSFSENAALQKGFDFTLPGVEADEAAKATDQNAQTTCFAAGDRVVIDLGGERSVRSFHYLPDQSEYSQGLVAKYEILAGLTPDQLTTVAQGEFSNIRNNPIAQSVYFTPVTARYLVFRAVGMVKEGERIGMAEIAVR